MFFFSYRLHIYFFCSLCIFRGLAYSIIVSHVKFVLVAIPMNFPFHFIHIPYFVAITNAHNHQQINDAFWFIHMELISFVSILIRCFETAALVANGFHLCVCLMCVANGMEMHGKTKPYRNMMNILNENTRCDEIIILFSNHLWWNVAYWRFYSGLIYLTRFTDIHSNGRIGIRDMKY